MNMSIRPFDTYEYVQELIRGGFSQELAEANMHALVKALDFMIEHKLVTQTEFEKVIFKLDSFENKLVAFENKFATKEELQATNEELKKVVLKLNEFENKFATKEELQTAIHKVEIEIQNIDHKIDKTFLKTVVATGSMMAIMMTISCSILGFLIKF